MRCRPRISWASSSVVPSWVVTRPSEVMTSWMGRVGSVSKRRSRLVRIPTRRRSASTIGTPLMRNLAMMSSAACTSSSGPSVTGSTIIPDSERFTLSTSSRWSSIERLRWITPMPPSRAMAMARRASVTVSMAAETSGMCQPDAVRDGGGDVDLCRDDVGRARNQAHVVEGETDRPEAVRFTGGRVGVGYRRSSDLRAIRLRGIAGSRCVEGLFQIIGEGRHHPMIMLRIRAAQIRAARIRRRRSTAPSPPLSVSRA